MPLPAPTFPLSPIKEIEIAAAKVPGAISLAQGIPSFSTPEVIREFVIDRIHAGAVDKYSLTLGLQELREEIAQSLARDGVLVDPDREIIITVGSIEGISASLLALLSPGDEVLIPSPSYASYQGAIGLARGVPKYFALDEDRNFDINIDTIRQAITPRTKVILFTSPNNPTGTLYSRTALEQLAELAAKHRIYVLMDEVYKDFYFTEDRHLSAITLPAIKELGIRACSFSKAFAMTGWRVGFIHGPAELIGRILRYHDALVTCAPVVSQYAAIAALRYGDQFLHEFVAEFKKRRDYCLQRLDHLASVLDVQVPKATYFVFPRIKGSFPLAHDSRALCFDILSRARVALVPGVAFGPTGEQHVRINFGREPAALEQAFDRLDTYFLKETIAPPRPSSPPATRNISRGIITRLCKQLAKIRLLRKQVTVVGIAGTKGKSEYKRTIRDGLASVRAIRGSYATHNTPLGMALSILGIADRIVQVKSFADRVRFLMSALYAALIAPIPEEALVIEYGANSSAEAAELLEICRPTWLVVTCTESVELAGSAEELRKAFNLLASTVGMERTLWHHDIGKEQSPAAVTFSPQGISSKEISAEALQRLTDDAHAGAITLSRELLGDSSRGAVAALLALSSRMGISSTALRL